MKKMSFVTKNMFSLLMMAINEAFDLKINKLKKWAIALMALIPSFIILLFFSICFPWLALLFILDFLLIIVFGILFAVHFANSNFDEFNGFTK